MLPNLYYALQIDDAAIKKRPNKCRECDNFSILSFSHTYNRIINSVSSQNAFHWKCAIAILWTNQRTFIGQLFGIHFIGKSHISHMIQFILSFTNFILDYVPMQV